MKTKITILILLLLTFINAVAQTPIFSENMGLPTGTTTIAANSFQNTPGTLSYSNGAQPGSADVRNTNVSPTSAGFSANGNVYFTSSTTYTSYGFSIENINASNFSSLSLQFGYRKELNGYHATFSIEYWNGSSWVMLANTTSALFNESSTANAGWYLSKTLSVPIDAQINGLKIRFVKTGTYAIRIDDVKLTGIEIPPTISTTTVTSVNSNSCTFGGTVTATGGSNIIATGTVYATSGNNSNPTIGGSGVTNIPSASPNAGTGSFTNNSGSVLSPNVQYTYRAYATKSTGLTGYGTVANFYTLALTPVTPSVTNPTASSLKITLGNDTNSAITTYCIFETTTARYVQTDGSLGATEVYQTAATWGNKTIVGLANSTTYTFQVKAKNADGVVTNYSPSTNGTTLPLPIITASGSLTALNTIYGTASSYTSFTVSGSNLTDNIKITPPSGFEVSVTGNGLSGYAGTQFLNQISGTVSATTVYIRLAATTGFGAYQGNISMSSINDGYTLDLATVPSSVNKLTITISGVMALDKPYDGNANANLGGSPVLNGLIAGDENSVSINSDNVQAGFVDELLGINKPVIVDGYSLTGTASNNYELAQPSGLTASILSSEESDIVINSSSPTNNNSNIDYTVYQGTQLTNTGSGPNGSLGVMGFYLRDGAGGHDADTLPTELTSLTLQVINPQLIKAARLFVGTSPRGQAVLVNGQSTINFTGLTNIVAPDDGQLAVNLRVTFNSQVTDNEQVIFIIDNATVSSFSSLFYVQNTGAINSVSDDDINRIEVKGQLAEFVQQPPTEVISTTVMAPSPTIVLKDSNGNVDLDFNTNFSVISSGTTALSQYQPGIFTNGEYSFNNIIHNVAGTNLHLSTNSTTLTNATSTSFTVGTIETPTFAPVNPVCEGGSFSLPATSLNGISGTWLPAVDNTQTTTYTFTPNPAQIATEANLTVVINPNVLPIFSPVAPINVGGSLNPLPTTSLNGISGTWSPALDNTQTTTYTFTPNAGFCATTATLTIAVYDSSIIIPSFTPVNPICVDTSLSLLPTTSNNGITGIWSPELDNTQTTTYTFTPDAAQNAVSTVLTIVVNPLTEPTFSPVSAVAYGATMSPSLLPLTSTNGVTGTWYPTLNNTATTTYVFTPNTGFCASATSLTIEVQQPAFVPIPPVIEHSETPFDPNYPTIPPIVYDRPISLTDTKGELSVSSSGTPIYKIPIALPPGIKDVAPQLALEYSGSSAQGIAGMGWNLNGISSIMRVSSRLDLDGVIDPVDFDNLDRFALDGQRLIPVSGDYGVAGTNYQTENYSNMKIEPLGSFGTVMGSPSYGPQSFVVTFPDGSQAFYGSTADSKALSEWKINRWIDPQGNYIDYSYFTENYVTRIVKITWGKNINSPSTYENTIEFSYKDRLRAEYSYIQGTEIATKKILSYIKVTTGGNLFRTYTLGHENIADNYQRVKYVVESNGDNTISNPIYFDYNNTPSGFGDFTEVGSLTGSQINKIDVSGDFDGNGSADFVANDKVYLNPIDNNNNWYGITLTAADKYIPVTIIDNNKLNQFQSVVAVNENDYDINYKIYSYNKATNQMDLKSMLNSNSEQFKYCYNNGTVCNFDPPSELDSSFLEGDFNGDGVTEMIHVRPAIRQVIDGFGFRYYADHYTAYFLNLKDNTITKNDDIDFIGNRANYTGDFNGDGRTDIISIDRPSGNYSVMQYNMQTNRFDFLFNGLFTEKIMSGSQLKQLVFGDFNGDGKTDIMIPLKNESTSWVLHLSTGNSFKYDLYSDFEYYQLYWHGSPTANRERVRTYRAADLNKDGKSDFITTEWESWSAGINNRNSRAYIRYKENIGSLNTKPTFAPNLPQQIYSSYGDPIVCLVGEFKNPQANFEFAFVQNGKMWKGQYNKDIEQEATLTKVKEVKDYIYTDISYKSLTPSSGLGVVNDVYHSGNTETYPYTEMISVPSMKVVDKVTVSWSGISKSQLYKYYGLVLNSRGLGILGFKKIAKSSWFNASNPGKIWSCVQSNPQLLGQKIYEWSYSGDDHTSFSNPPITTTGTNDLGITINTYTTNTLASGVRIIVPNKTVKKDFLTGLTNQTEYFYDSHWNVNRTLFTNAIGTKEVVNTLYDNISGVGRLYAVGRVTQVNETISNYGGTYTTEQKYTYHPTQVNLIKQSQKKGHNTDYITEDYQYDVYGNVTQKSVSAPSVSTRITKDKYDNNGRFVVEKTDIEGFVSKFEYNKLGQVTKSVSPLNVVSISNYNAWGLLTGITISGATTSAKKSVLTYSREFNGDFISTTTNLGTNEVSRFFMNKLGQNFKSTTKGFASGTWISKVIEYDFLGRKSRESEPYLDSNPTTGVTAGVKWNLVTYDYLSRPHVQTSYNGRIQTLEYDGLTTTTTDGPKTIEVTYDANGNKRIVKDNNETLNFNYYASGLQKEAVYGNHTITYNYDGWGRNTSMLDPSVSATAYSNTYNNYGELLTATTPTGSSTMTYSPTGRVMQKTSNGQNTTIQSTYSYNAKGLLISETGISNGKSFTYTNTYNSLSQLVSKKEITPDNFTHVKLFTYDGQGKLFQEQTSSFISNNPSVNNGNVTIEYGYNSYNGMLEQYKDVATSTVLWKLNSANERMQALTAVLGNGMQITNTYDADCYVNAINHSTATNVALNLEYDFVRDRGTLNWRKNNVANVLSWNETFTYDGFERLTSWTDPTGTASNTYASDGRITENSAIGTYNYGGSSRYKRTTADLNTNGEAFYLSRTPQYVTYNMFKSPVSISELSRGSVTFEYNMSGERSKSTVLDEDGTTIKKTKFYSGISEVEVIEKPNQTLQFITYLAGSPYDAFVTLEKSYAASGSSYTPTTQEFLYLHRDYQGTILAISGNGGTIKERRIFDPWGNLKKKYIGNTAVADASLALVDFELLTDRGYTGHEHFFSVGIIHMNGRIYDPVLHTFLSADPLLQSPENSQNYNRYAYCFNNPLLYTDPSGNFIVESAILSAVIIGAIIGGVAYIGMAFYTGTFSWGGLAKSIIVGAASGAASFGVGNVIKSLTNSILSSAGNTLTVTQIRLMLTLPQALMHGVAQGFIQGVSGGNLGQSFLTAAISSIAAGGYGMAAGEFAESGAGQILFGTFAGGATASLVGGNFWEGAVTGLTVSGLNHAAHQIVEKHNFFRRLREHYESKTGDDFFITQKEFKWLISKGKINHNEFIRVGDNRYEASIDFYDSDKDLALSFGRATVSYTSINGKIVYDGFYDKYDFDSKPWGVRTYKNEIITRLYNGISNGKSFEIFYNKLNFSSCEKNCYIPYNIGRF
jgi:RHS repeat-associated protein